MIPKIKIPSIHQHVIKSWSCLLVLAFAHSLVPLVASPSLFLSINYLHERTNLWAVEEKEKGNKFIKEILIFFLLVRWKLFFSNRLFFFADFLGWGEKCFSIKEYRLLAIKDGFVSAHSHSFPLDFRRENLIFFERSWACLTKKHKFLVISNLFAVCFLLHFWNNIEMVRAMRAKRH